MSPSLRERHGSGQLCGKNKSARGIVNLVAVLLGTLHPAIVIDTQPSTCVDTVRKYIPLWKLLSLLVTERFSRIKSCHTEKMVQEAPEEQSSDFTQIWNLTDLSIQYVGRAGHHLELWNCNSYRI